MILYGENQSVQRMKRDNMKPNTEVSINHNFYVENPMDHETKHEKSESRERHKDGDQIGMEGRQKKAIGAVAKVRRGFKLKPAI